MIRIVAKPSKKQHQNLTTSMSIRDSCHFLDGSLQQSRKKRQTFFVDGKANGEE
jgi:hypothetical protein